MLMNGTRKWTKSQDLSRNLALLPVQKLDSRKGRPDFEFTLKGKCLALNIEWNGAKMEG